MYCVKVVDERGWGIRGEGIGVGGNEKEEEEKEDKVVVMFVNGSLWYSTKVNMDFEIGDSKILWKLFNFDSG